MNKRSTVRCFFYRPRIIPGHLIEPKDVQTYSLTCTMNGGGVVSTCHLTVKRFWVRTSDKSLFMSVGHRLATCSSCTPPVI